MNLSFKQLREAAGRGVITPEQCEALISETEANAARSVKARFDSPHFILFFGALIVISAMTWFNTEGWERFGSAGVTGISLSMALLFMLGGALAWHGAKMKVPGGLFFTMAVCVMPLIVFGFLKWAGRIDAHEHYGEFYRHVAANYVMMEVATVAAGFTTLLFIQYPLITAPIAVAFWFLSMDLAPFVYGREISFWNDEWKGISIGVGLIMTLVAYLLDRRTKEDFSAWLYFFGVAAVWAPITTMDSGSEFGKAMYCALNVALMVTSVFLNRRAFMLFGVIGVLAYLNHLAWQIFRESGVFPFALILIGLGIMVCGIAWLKNQKEMAAWWRIKMPGFLNTLIPTRARE